MFYSPFDACHVCGEYVLLDQTCKQCAAEHDCRVEKCPLERFFAADCMDETLVKRSPEPKSQA